MLFITTYRTKPFMTKEQVKELMELSAANPPGDDQVAHYVAADGSHGVIVSDIADAGVGYAEALRFSQFMEFETKPMLTFEEALPHILEELA